jgi:hypothetical protein
MSFARDPLQEVKKIDISVAHRIERLHLDPAENMLLGAIILDCTVHEKELIGRLNRLLKQFSRSQDKFRLKEYHFLIHGNETIDGYDNMTHHESMKKLLRELPQSSVRDLTRDSERVKMIKTGMSMMMHERLWNLNGWKNAIIERQETKNSRNVKIVKLQPPTDESYFMPSRYMADIKEQDDEKKPINQSTFGAVRCLTCACYHAVGFCPITEKNESRSHRLGTSAIKMIRSQLGL